MGSQAEQLVSWWVSSTGTHRAEPLGTSDGTAYEEGEEFASHFQAHREREGEGKCPDILVIDAYLHVPVFVVEVKFSNQSAKTPRMGVILKDEELGPLHLWRRENGLPILIAQVFTDAVFVISYERFLWRVDHGLAREIVYDKTNKKTWIVNLNAANPVMMIAHGKWATLLAPEVVERMLESY